MLGFRCGELRPQALRKCLVQRPHATGRSLRGRGLSQPACDDRWVGVDLGLVLWLRPLGHHSGLCGSQGLIPCLQRTTWKGNEQGERDQGVGNMSYFHHLTPEGIASQPHEISREPGPVP